MITTYAFVQPVESPTDAMTNLIGTLTDEGVTDAEVALQRVDVAGYAFRITAPEEGSNLTILQSLCGVLNTVAAQGAPMLAARAAERGSWRVAGGEGRFAAEHPPPRNSA